MSQASHSARIECEILNEKCGICMFTFLECDFRENVIPNIYMSYL